MSVDFSELRPLNATILIQFLDETGGSKGRFQERTKGSIIIPVLGSNQISENRWAQVVAIGPDVVNIKVGEFILVAAGKWTSHETFKGEKIWKTVDIVEAVLAVTDDEA